MSDVSSKAYPASAPDQPLRAALHGRMETDVCIVGAGYIGPNTAVALAKRGWRVVVLEAARVGRGPSGRNGGQIVHSYSLSVACRRARATDRKASAALCDVQASQFAGKPMVVTVCKWPRPCADGIISD